MLFCVKSDNLDQQVNLHSYDALIDLPMQSGEIN
jgi:hypothetical protein